MLTWSLKWETFLRFINHLQGKQNKTRIVFLFTVICSTFARQTLLNLLGVSRCWVRSLLVWVCLGTCLLPLRRDIPFLRTRLFFFKMQTQRHHGGLPLWGDVSASPFLWPFLPVLFCFCNVVAFVFLVLCYRVRGELLSSHAPPL